LSIFLTSDTHFCHDKDFLYRPRGYNNIKDMNEDLVQKWNDTITNEDIVYFLGDLCLTDTTAALEYIKRLNGSAIFWIFGNHDTKNKVDLIKENCQKFIPCGTSTVIKYHKISCLLSHYPTITSNYDEKHFNQHVINFHGHTHQQSNFINVSNPFMYHVGIDSHNGYPVKIDDAIDEIRENWMQLDKMVNINNIQNSWSAAH